VGQQLHAENDRIRAVGDSCKDGPQSQTKEKGKHGKTATSHASTADQPDLDTGMRSLLGGRGKRKTEMHCHRDCTMVVRAAVREKRRTDAKTFPPSAAASKTFFSGQKKKRRDLGVEELYAGVGVLGILRADNLQNKRK